MDCTENVPAEMAAAAAISLICFAVSTSKQLQEIGRRKKKKLNLFRLRSKRKSSNVNSHDLLREYRLSKYVSSFKSLIQMDEKCFQELLSYLVQDIKKSDAIWRSVSPEERLSATLHYLATGENFSKVAMNTNLSTSYLCKSVLEVCDVIYNKLQSDFLQFPESKEKWIQIAEEFETKWQFPLCLGALDAQHVVITPKRQMSDLYYNCKGFHSIVLLAMADANAKFLYIDVGLHGNLNNGKKLLQKSDLITILENSTTYFPQPKVIGKNLILPYVIVAGNAFPNVKNIVTPFNETVINLEQEIFNTRLNKALQNIERAFSILSNRFKILRTKISLDEYKAIQIVKASCVLHNFLIQRSSSYINYDIQTVEPSSVNTWYVDSTLKFETLRSADNHISATQITEMKNLRQKFQTYFCSEGKM